MIKKTISLHNDFKRTGVDITGTNVSYEIYQDLNIPTMVLVIELTTSGTATTELYHLTQVTNTTAFNALWNDRVNITYKNLIDLNIDNKLN